MSMLLSTKEENGKWDTLSPLQAKCPALNPICIGQSIWISSGCDESEKGMIRFCCSSNRIKQIIPYPHEFEPIGHSVCGLDGNRIMIIDGVPGKMRIFNVINKKYGPEITIPKLGGWVSSIMIRGYLHIMHGMEDVDSKYLVYSTVDGTLSEFKGNHQYPRSCSVAITKGPDDTFYKFGGYDEINKKPINSFYVGRLQHDDPSKPIQWKKNDHFTLKEPLSGSAYIHYNHWIIIFGGETSGFTKVDDIYILDVRSKKGWIQSPIKCPMKSLYVAVLDHQQRVHLLTYYEVNKQHYCIALSELISDVVIDPMEAIQSQHDDDEKGADEEAKSVKITKHVQKAEVSQRVSEELKEENQRVKRENAALQSVNVELMEKQKGMESELLTLRMQIAGYQEEQKEFIMKINELEDEVKEWKLKVLDTSNFMKWDWTQIHLWIMGLEGGRFIKYEVMLKDALCAAEFTAEDLLEVTPLVIKMWGIKDKEDRDALNMNIQRLVQQQGSHGGGLNLNDVADPKGDEGTAPTAFV